MGLGRLAIRGTVGTLFIGHGMQKLTGSFGGHGLQGTAQFFEGSLGMRPGKRHALAGGIAEAAGGALLVAGLATPLAVASLSSVMFTAIRKVHLKNGPWSTNGGYEYNVVLLAALAALAEAGPGKLSLDAARGKERKGTGWMVAALGAGALASTLAIESARRNEERHQAEQEQQHAPERWQAPAEDAQTADEQVGTLV